MPVIEYKTKLGDLCKVKFTIDIQDPEIKIEFIEWINRYCRSLPQNKTFKEFGKRSHLKKEINQKENWLAYNALRAKSALSIFISSTIKIND